MKPGTEPIPGGAPKRLKKGKEPSELNVADVKRRLSTLTETMSTVDHDLDVAIDSIVNMRDEIQALKEEVARLEKSKKDK